MKDISQLGKDRGMHMEKTEEIDRQGKWGKN